MVWRRAMEIQGGSHSDPNEHGINIRGPRCEDLSSDDFRKGAGALT